uniref:Pre-mRNA splicing Prp18-interacting factor n=1 Tax=Tanacetum cinerariifolium TaxID=118510 RepID=A0A6L2MI26_TANCI|nr:hypothetical protein [Tanacetum cinerariifolium]
MYSFNQQECLGCGQPYEGPSIGGFCLFCASNSENSFSNVPNPNSFDDSQNLSDYSPQPQDRATIKTIMRITIHIIRRVFFVVIIHAQPEDTNELFYKLLEDLQIIREELSEYINSPSWNYPTFYDDDEEHSIQYKEYLENSSNAIKTVLPTEEPEYSLSMGYEHLSTIPEIESDEFIESSAKNLVPIPSEYKVTSEDKSECDLPVCEYHSEILSDSNNDDFSSDNDAFEDIEYVGASPLDSELVNLEEENDVTKKRKSLT